MSQVIKYEVPTGERLLCENPACDLPAELVASVSQPGKEDSGEVFGCSAHLTQLVSGKRVLGVRKLKVPGRRNDAEG